MKELKLSPNRFIAIYARKSKYTNKGDSISAQIENCKEKIKRLPSYNESIEIKEFSDNGFSGGNTNRPQFKELLECCRKNQVSLVVCYKIDRISRSLRDYVDILREFDTHNVEFMCSSQDFSTLDCNHKFMMNIFMAFAEMERDMISERIRDNMLSLARTGRWLGGTTPLGYESVQQTEVISLDSNKIRYLHKLEVVPEEKEIFMKIYKKYKETGSLTQVERYSHEMGIRTRNGKYFSISALGQLFRNPVYAAADQNMYEYFSKKGAVVSGAKASYDGTRGLMVYNKMNQNGGKSHQQHPVEEWIVAVGEHEPFMTGEEWLKFQERLELSRSRKYRSDRKNSALLSGILRCGNCGSFMRPKGYNSVDINGNKNFGYLCEEKEKSRRTNCDMKNPHGLELDKLVCREIKKLSENSAVFLKQLDYAEEKIFETSDDNRSELKELKKEDKNIERQKENIMERLSNEPAENVEFTESMRNKYNSLNEKQKVIRESIYKLESINNNQMEKKNQIERLKETFSSFPTTFDAMPNDKKRELIHELIEVVIWDGNSAHIYFKGRETKDEILSKFLEPLDGGSK